MTFKKISKEEAEKIAQAKFGEDVYVGSFKEIWIEAEKIAKIQGLPVPENISIARLDGTEWDFCNELWMVHEKELLMNHEGEFWFIMMPEKTNFNLVKRAGLEPFVIQGKIYHTPLPDELRPYYVYTIDGGHSLIVFLDYLQKPGQSPDLYLVPAPVKTVLRTGYHIDKGYLISRINYSSETGLITEEGDDEY